MVKNVLLVKRPCFLSNINDSMKGFTHNRRYSEYTRVGLGVQSGDKYPPLLILRYTTQAVASITHTETPRACSCVFLRRSDFIFHFSLPTSCESPAEEEILYSCTFILM